MPGRRTWVLAAAVMFALLALAPHGAQATSPVVVRASLDGEIDNATASYVAQAVKQAETDRAAALVLVMNTPGGYADSMDAMVTSLLNSRVPVVAYVAPSGARADSAGLFVAQAADVVAMAPGTNIGSAHPIQASGANIGGELEQKVVNDAVTRIRSLAQMHGRNADWCEQAVRQSVNVSSEQAVKLDVADLQASDLPALLTGLDGRVLHRPDGTVLTLQVAGATVRDVAMPLPLQIYQLLLDPNVAYLLLLVAIFGLIAEFTTPGAVLPGTVGAIAAILAVVSFTSLPVNVAGVALVLLAFALFVVDLKAPTHGVLTVGGAISLVLGSLFLIDAGPFGTGISPFVIAAAAVLIVVLFAFVLGKAVRARSRPAYDVTATPGGPTHREGMP